MAFEININVFRVKLNNNLLLFYDSHTERNAVSEGFNDVYYQKTRGKYNGQRLIKTPNFIMIDSPEVITKKAYAH